MLGLEGHTKVKASWGGDLVLVAVSFVTNGSNVLGSFAHSGSEANPITVAGSAGSPEIYPGPFKALRGVVRLAGPVTGAVAATPGPSATAKLTITTVASNSYAYLFFLEV